jgi:hypothetical protein
MRDDLRRLAQRLRPTHGESAKAMASLYFVRLWCDWGRAGVQWRPLDNAFGGHVHRWDKEPIAYILEEFCEWKGETGELVKLWMEVGMLTMVQRGDLWGMTLNDFWTCNVHLSPDYKTTQQRGGLAKAERRRQADVDDMAAQQQRLLEAQGALVFSEALKVSEEEEKRAIAFLMRMDRACGAPVRHTSEYNGELLTKAVGIIRTYKNESIVMVERYLHKNRDNVEVVKIPNRVVANFDAYFGKAE